MRKKGRTRNQISDDILTAEVSVKDLKTGFRAINKRTAGKKNCAQIGADRKQKRKIVVTWNDNPLRKQLPHHKVDRLNLPFSMLRCNP